MLVGVRVSQKEVPGRWPRQGSTEATLAQLSSQECCPPPLRHLGAMQALGGKVWHPHSITVSTFPAQGPQRAAGSCRPLIFHIISHLMNPDGGDSPQPTLTGRMLGICHDLNSWKQQRERAWSSCGGAIQWRGATG